MAAATIRDVAREADVGIATVSRVINNSPVVSEVTRQKVLNVIRELDYAPNPIAQRLSTGLTHTIAVILPHLTFPSYVERLRGIQNALANTDYGLILYSAENIERRDQLLYSVPRKSRTDGVLIISIPVPDHFVERISKAEIPTVLVDAYHEKISHITVDDIAGGHLATQHLLDLGHRQIGFISEFLDSPFKFGASSKRLQGYKQALNEAGIAFNPDYHLEGNLGHDEAKLMAKKMLTSTQPPTAIFAVSDTQAIGVLDAAKELGITVPDRLSVIGYDGIRDAEYINLTTVEQPLFESGYHGIELLLSTIDASSQEPQEIRQEIKLVVRGTTAPIQ